jgi:hypothetical protein
MDFHFPIEPLPPAAPIITDITGKALVERKRTATNNAVNSPTNSSGIVPIHVLSSLLALGKLSSKLAGKLH